MLALIALVAACGSTNPAEDDEVPAPGSPKAYREAIAATDAPGCEDAPPVPPLDGLPIYSSTLTNDGCLVEFEGCKGNVLTTYCEGTTCHCLHNGEVVCACETDVPWCAVPSSSCCPDPWP